MMAITHAAIATAGVSFLFSTADPLPLALAVLGSQLPDLDTTTNVIGQVCYPTAVGLKIAFPIGRLLIAWSPRLRSQLSHYQSVGTSERYRSLLLYPWGICSPASQIASLVKGYSSFGLFQRGHPIALEKFSH